MSASFLTAPTTHEAEMRPLYERLVAARAKRDAILSKPLVTVEQTIAFDKAQDEVTAAIRAIDAAKSKAGEVA